MLFASGILNFNMAAAPAPRLRRHNQLVCTAARSCQDSSASSAKKNKAAGEKLGCRQITMETIFQIVTVKSPNFVTAHNFVTAADNFCEALLGFQLYSGRTKYSAFVSKLNKLSEEYLSPQKTQKAAVFFIQKILGRRMI